jgi:hypothetical protein
MKKIIEFIKKQRKSKKQTKLINHIEHCEYKIHWSIKRNFDMKTYYFRKQIELTKNKLSSFKK